MKFFSNRTMAIILILVGALVAGTVCNSLVHVRNTNPPYRLATDGQQYIIQERCLFWYANLEGTETWDKTMAINTLENLNLNMYRRTHPPKWTVIATTNLPPEIH